MLWYLIDMDEGILRVAETKKEALDVYINPVCRKVGKNAYDARSSIDDNGMGDRANDAFLCHGKEAAYKHGFMWAIKEYERDVKLQKIREKAPNNWFYCEDVLPEMDEDVIVFTSRYEEFIAHVNDEGDWYDDSGIIDDEINIVAWHPLPVPPDVIPWYVFDKEDGQITGCYTSKRAALRNIGIGTRAELVGEYTYLIKCQNEDGSIEEYGMLYFGKEAVIAGGYGEELELFERYTSPHQDLVRSHVAKTNPYGGPTSSEYNLNAMAKYVKNQGKTAGELTGEELEQFGNR